MRYVPGDLEDAIKDAFKKHTPLKDLAARTGFSLEELDELLGLKPSTPAASEPAVDLWRVDRLDGLL